MITQTQLLKYQETEKQIKALTSELEGLKVLFKRSPGDVEKGKLMLIVLTEENKSIGYKAIVEDIKTAHPELSDEVIKLVASYTKPKPTTKVRVVETNNAEKAGGT